MSKALTTKTATAAYLAEFLRGIDADRFNEIGEAAASDQQAGIAMHVGRKAYTDVAENSHYHNAWMYSIKTNGVPKQFRR